MAVFLAPIINDQQEDANGAPLSGGTVEVYLAGTSTPATTYSDKAGLVPNTWPIVLNTLGVNNQGAVWLTGGAAYKYVIKNSFGVVQRTIDNVSGINDSAVAADQWAVYQGAPTYVSATSFTVVGDQTQIFQVGRRLKSSNTGGAVYSTIVGSVYGAPNTTVTVTNDSGVLDSGLSAVSYGVMSVLDTSLPGGAINYGQCLLTKSGANLLLSRLNGSRITINGSICVIPAAGVTLAPGAVTPGTLYYIYAFMSGATLTLEASTTVPAIDAVTGVKIKTGDATRTCVGMARPIAGPAWSDIAAQRFVISWFNRRSIDCKAPLGTNVTSSSLTAAEISTQLRCEFLSWSDSASPFNFSGYLTSGTAGIFASTFYALDGAVVDGYTNVITASTASPYPVALSTVIPVGTAEGYHYTTMLGAQSSASVATYAGSAGPGSRGVNYGVIQG